jgi:hypothetical protein
MNASKTGEAAVVAFPVLEKYTQYNNEKKRSESQGLQNAF